MDQETARKQEAGFLSYPGDAAAVYRFDAGMAVDRSEPLERVRLSGGSPMESGFDLIATGPIMQGADTVAMLDEYRANGFIKPGDIVAFKQAGALSCWSVDLLAYNRLHGLLENPLKTAELDMEQNCNQIDGIINNTAQVHRLAAQNILECRTALGGSPLELVSLDILGALREIEERAASKPSLRDNLKQCQREAADRSQGSASPGRRGPEKER